MKCSGWQPCAVGIWTSAAAARRNGDSAASSSRVRHAIGDPGRGRRAPAGARTADAQTTSSSSGLSLNCRCAKKPLKPSAGLNRLTIALFSGKLRRALALVASAAEHEPQGSGRRREDQVFSRCERLIPGRDQYLGGGANGRLTKQVPVIDLLWIGYGGATCGGAFAITQCYPARMRHIFPSSAPCGPDAPRHHPSLRRRGFPHRRRGFVERLTVQAVRLEATHA